MSFTRTQALFIARCLSCLEDGPPVGVTTFEEVDPTTGASSDEWNTKFLETVVPVIKQGSQYLTASQEHRDELLRSAKSLLDDFSKESFDCITAILANPKLNWGRIVALFTFSSFVSAELVRKGRQTDVATLEEWLVEFLCQNDFSAWISENGEWINTHKEGEETTSRWSWLAPLKDYFFSPRESRDEGNVMQRERDMEEENGEYSRESHESTSSRVEELLLQVHRLQVRLLESSQSEKTAIEARLNSLEEALSDHKTQIKERKDRETEKDELLKAKDVELAELRKQIQVEHMEVTHLREQLTLMKEVAEREKSVAAREKEVAERERQIYTDTQTSHVRESKQVEGNVAEEVVKTQSELTDQQLFHQKRIYDLEKQADHIEDGFVESCRHHNKEFRKTRATVSEEHRKTIDQLNVIQVTLDSIKEYLSNIPRNLEEAEEPPDMDYTK